MIIPSGEQLYRKIDEAVRGLVGFNAAGIAGIIALAGKAAPMSTSLRVAGLIFLFGVFAGVAAWVLSIPGPPSGYGSTDRFDRDINREMKFITTSLYLAAGAFLLGVTFAFFTA